PQAVSGRDGPNRAALARRSGRRRPSPRSDAEESGTMKDKQRQSIAILGTGKMGSAIATRLSASGSELFLWNRTRSRAEALGIGTVADIPATAARSADIVISSLTGSEAVLAAYLGRDGALTAGE